MPRGKKNKGNSGAAPPNNNKTKSPTAQKNVETVVTLTPEVPAFESDKSNEDLKVRLATAKERLNLLQEVIGGIGDPTDVENLDASGIDAAKNKLAIIQDSVDAVKTTLLEVRQDASRSITPDGSVGGTNKRRKNKKQHNQNPPKGFVVREPSAAKSLDVPENKCDKDDSGNEKAEEDGTSTISKKKRNRNRKKAQQEQLKSGEGELLTEAAVAKLEEKEEQIEDKKIVVEESKSKNKKNQKKGQPNPNIDVKIEPDSSPNLAEETRRDDVQPETSKVPTEAITKKDSQPGKNRKNQKKQDQHKCELSEGEKANIVEDIIRDQKDKCDDIVKIDDRTEVTKTDCDLKSVEIKEEPTFQIQNEKKSDQAIANTKNESQQNKKGQQKRQISDSHTPVCELANIKAKEPLQQNKKGQQKRQTPDSNAPVTSLLEEKQVENIKEELKPAIDESSSEKLLPTVDSEKHGIKEKPDSPKTDHLNNKKDKKKGLTENSRSPVTAKIEEQQIQTKQQLSSEKVAKSVVDATSSDLSDEMVVSKDEPKVNVVRQEVGKNKKDKKKGQTTVSEPATEGTVDGQQNKMTEALLPEKTPEVSISLELLGIEKIEMKGEISLSTPASQKDKKGKNRPATSGDISDKKDETLTTESNKETEGSKILTDASKATAGVGGKQPVTTKEKNQSQIISPIGPITAVEKVDIPETPKAIITEENIAAKVILDNNNGAVVVEGSSKQVLLLADETKKVEPVPAPLNAPSIIKLDFSQVVKDNKDKIPLMEIPKVLPDLTSTTATEIKEIMSTTKTIEAVATPISHTTVKTLVETRDQTPVDAAVKTPVDVDTIVNTPVDAAAAKAPVDPTQKTPVDATAKTPVDAAAKAPLDAALNTPVDVTIKTPVDATVKTPVDATVKTLVDAAANLLIETAVKPTATVSIMPQEKSAVEAVTLSKQNKSKAPELKGHQKNEPKKQGSQQGKGQSTKSKQVDPKLQSPIKEDVLTGEIAKLDSYEVIAETDSVTATVSIEAKSNDKIKNQQLSKEILKKEQAQKKNVEKKVEPKSSETLETLTEAIAIEEKAETGKQEKSELKSQLADKQQPVFKDKVEKEPHMQASENQVIEQSKATEAQIKDKSLINPLPHKTGNQRHPEQSIQRPPETSKKDQKKQNKTKGKAPQPPDIPMDMSLLSASMIDAPTVAADEIITQEESEDQSSLITSDSKNVLGSDFVQSAESLKAMVDDTKSQENVTSESKNETKVTELLRVATNSSPTSDKRSKEEANIKRFDEMQEAKTVELPEKNAQQKLEPIQFPAVKLMDILEAKMTSPAVKPGNVAGNVRKLPKDTKKSDQLKIQQQKSRSKSPKENMAEKYVKNQKLACGDRSKCAAQNLKKELLSPEVRATVSTLCKEKQEIKTIKGDANYIASENVPGTAPTTIAVAKTEQVDRKHDVVENKQKNDSLPENTKLLDATLHNLNAAATIQDVNAVIGEDPNPNKKPKIAPKPDVSTKIPPKPVDRSNKSCESNQSKSSVQASPATSTKSSYPQNTEQKSNAKRPEISPKPLNLSSTNVSKTQPASPDEEEEFVEYKFTPRPVFISTTCQICKAPLETSNPCKLCQMVSYCCDEHAQEDQMAHGPLCNAIQEIAKKRGGHIYNNARILNDDDYRSLRVHTLNLCESFLKRHLLPFEREILLFPRLCSTGTCREWRQQSLIECNQCGQVSYCAAHPEHLPEIHGKWCNSFNLYQKIVLRQKNFGRIEPSLPSKIMLKTYALPDNIDDVLKTLYKNYGAIKDECIYATLTQLATAPLTAFYGAQQNHQEIGEIYTIHLVGAELQFEADTLDKWETFFLHLVPNLVEFRVCFIGPELNAENLPLEVLSRIRMCRTCRQNCRIVKFDFQCGILYHDYVNSSAFTKPDLICFFNPGLYRSTGFNGLDTWPYTIKAATSINCPIIITSYTQLESPKDFERIQKESDRPLSIVQPPHINPFGSQRPERNFISDEIAPMIFKNFYCFCVK